MLHIIELIVANVLSIIDYPVFNELYTDRPIKINNKRE